MKFKIETCTEMSDNNNMSQEDIDAKQQKLAEEGMNDYMDYMHEASQARIFHNNEILNTIFKEKGEAFHQDLLAYCVGLENIGKVSIKSEPIGTIQKEDCGQIEHVWITQTTGFFGDDFHGTACIKLSEKRYLHVPYSMT